MEGVRISIWRKVVTGLTEGGAVSVSPLSRVSGPRPSGVGRAVGKVSGGCLRKDRGRLVLADGDLEAKHYSG